MKVILCAVLSLPIGISAGQADPLATSPRAGSARFAAMSLTNDQGVRAIVSNVLVAANGAAPVPCQVRVSFFGADGSPVGDVARVELKAGESTSVPASRPSKLVRATVSIADNVADQVKACALRTRLEIFDLQTGITFVSVPGESAGSNSECVVSAAPGLGATRRNLSGQTNSAPVAAPSTSGRALPPQSKPPVLAATPPAVPR